MGATLDECCIYRLFGAFLMSKSFLFCSTTHTWIPEIHIFIFNFRCGCFESILFVHNLLAETDRNIFYTWSIFIWDILGIRDCHIFACGYWTVLAVSRRLVKTASYPAFHYHFRFETPWEIRTGKGLYLKTHLIANASSLKQSWPHFVLINWCTQIKQLFLICACLETEEERTFDAKASIGRNLGRISIIPLQFN